MIRLCVDELQKATGAQVVCGSGQVELHGVCTDTRVLSKGVLFVALSGPNFDGNQFAQAAIAKGASALLLGGDLAELEVLRRELPSDVALLHHPDPRRALSDLGAWHRSRLNIPVIGVTGSCGKTTTKNMLVELLSNVRRVVGSPSSFNNDIGVPHTLFLADEETEVLVVEMGTNHPGEIAGLCRTARPNAAILTNIGASHLEGLHSVEGVAREKGDLIACLPQSGFMVLGADCPWTAQMRSLSAARATTFSVDGEGDLNATNVWFHAAGTTFRLNGHEVTFPLLGLHNVQNLLAALAACLGVGVKLEEILPFVSELSGSRRRLEKKTVGALTLLDDTYNANPESANASVRVLAGFHGHGRRVFVLGDMLELGDLAAELHHGVGQKVAEAGIDLLIVVGELTRATAAGAREGGLPKEHIVHYPTLESALVEIPELVKDGDIVLVKGSRAMGLERLVAQLMTSHSDSHRELAGSGDSQNNSGGQSGADL